MYKQDNIEIREVIFSDYDFVVNLMKTALHIFYGGDHEAHAKRIFNTHISGGKDSIGHFSFEQKMFIITVDNNPVGMLHLVGKRQGNYKISPIIIYEKYRGKRGIGSILLNFAESYVKKMNARQIYCTVAEQNHNALQFFLKKGFIVAGHSYSHYMDGINEIMLYKILESDELLEIFDRPNISVLPYADVYELQARNLLKTYLPKYFNGIDDVWIDSLFNGYKRRESKDINLKYKLIYVAVDRDENLLGIVGATPKKGEPIKLMPFIATTLPAFVALLVDIPYELLQYGHKLYIHITPTVEQTITLQQNKWSLDAAMPAAYREDQITQQWSLDIKKVIDMRLMRVKKRFIDLIIQGRKTLEVRVGYSSIKNIQVGEKIKFASRELTQIVRVTNVRNYLSFEEMLIKEDGRKIAPDISNDAELLKLLKDIYPAHKENLGVVVLEITAENKNI